MTVFIIKSVHDINSANKDIESDSIIMTIKGYKMTYSIDDLEMIEHPDGRREIIVTDEALKLILDGLDAMNLTLPVSADDEEVIFEYLADLDSGIGNVESEGIRPTREYDERVCRAVDEFNPPLDTDFIDYDKVNKRVSELLVELGTDGKYTLDYERWLPRVEKKPNSKKNAELRNKSV